MSGEKKMFLLKRFWSPKRLFFPPSCGRGRGQRESKHHYVRVSTSKHFRGSRLQRPAWTSQPPTPVPPPTHPLTLPPRQTRGPWSLTEVAVKTLFMCNYPSVPHDHSSHDKSSNPRSRSPKKIFTVVTIRSRGHFWQSVADRGLPHSMFFGATGLPLSTGGQCCRRRTCKTRNLFFQWRNVVLINLNIKKTIKISKKTLKKRLYFISMFYINTFNIFWTLFYFILFLLCFSKCTL